MEKVSCSTCDYCITEETYWGDIGYAKCSKKNKDVIIYFTGKEEKPLWCPIKERNNYD